MTGTRSRRTSTRSATSCSAPGLRFAYHNHDFEFKKLPSGEMGYDILLKECDPKLVKMEMDLYWITKGGQDPLAYFAKWPGRFPLVHVKDMSGSGEIVDVGKGTHRLEPHLREASRGGDRAFLRRERQSEVADRGHQGELRLSVQVGPMRDRETGDGKRETEETPACEVRIGVPRGATSWQRGIAALGALSLPFPASRFPLPRDSRPIKQSVARWTVRQAPTAGARQGREGHRARRH